MGLLANAQSWLTDVMTAEGQAITITRGATTISLVAMPDEPHEVEVNPEGMIVGLPGRMFAVARMDLATLVLPQDGDTIQLGDQEFLVLPMSGGRTFQQLDNRNSRIAINAIERAAFTSTIVYSSGNVDVPDLLAVRGDWASKSINRFGVTESTQFSDFIVSVSDFDSEPMPGHRITEVIGSKVVEFEVNRINSEPAWRWFVQGTRSLRRIHTKQVKETVN